MRRKNCVLMPAAGRRTQFFRVMFTEPRAHHKVHPCTMNKYCCHIKRCRLLSALIQQPFCRLDRKESRAAYLCSPLHMADVRNCVSPRPYSRVTTKTLSATFSAENYCLILGILGLGKNSSFRQHYLVFGYFLMLGTQSSIRLVSERKHASHQDLRSAPHSSHLKYLIL